MPETDMASPMNPFDATSNGGTHNDESLRDSRGPSAEGVGSTEKPVVSIIIPTFNSEKGILAVLGSVDAQDYPSLETIIVDNFSKDQTLQRIAEMNKKRIVIKYSSRRARARNVGASVARGEFLYNVDSDMILSRSVVSACLEACRDGSADAVIVPEYSSGRGYWAESAGMLKDIVRGVPGHEAARFIRKSAFARIGGYDEMMEAGEDFDLHYRLLQDGARIRTVSAPVIHDLDKIGLQELISKYRHYGGTIELFRIKHLPRLSGRRSLARLVLRKWRILARRPLQAIGF